MTIGPRRPAFYLGVPTMGFILGGFLSALLRRFLPAGPAKEFFTWARRAAGADWSADHGYGEADGLRAVQTDDDLTVAILGPEQFYRANRFTLVGTVLSGDLPRRSLRLMHAATGSTRTLVADVVGQVVADTLADADVGDLPEGDWECTLEVRSADAASASGTAAFVSTARRPSSTRCGCNRHGGAASHAGSCRCGATIRCACASRRRPAARRSWRMPGSPRRPSAA